MRPMSEPERLWQLLGRLRRGPWHEVPVDLLREPQLGTRPAVKPVAHYPKVQQVYPESFPRLAVFGLLSVAVLWVVAAQVAALEAWLLTVVSVPWWRDAVQLVLGPAAWIIVPIVLSLAALNLCTASSPRPGISWPWISTNCAMPRPTVGGRFRRARVTPQAGACGTGCAWNWKTAACCCGACPWPTASC